MGFGELFVKDFHNVWFASVMGTGISACILYEFPYPLEWLRVLGIMLFAVALFLFILHNVLFVLKNFVWYRDWEFMTNVKQSVFLGCYPMGLATLINMISFMSLRNWFIFEYVLFWINFVTSVGCAWGVTFVIFRTSAIHDFHEHGMNATLLLPLVTLTVTSSTGSLMFDKIPVYLQLFHMIVCFMTWANTVALSFAFLPIYFAKLYITKLPPKPMIFTTFIPIGVMGQGAFGIVLLSDCCSKYLQSHPHLSPEILLPVQVICIMIALFLLSFGYFMTFLAVTSTLSTGIHSKFTKNWWAMTFPLGTMAVGNSKLGTLYNLQFFRVLGCIYGVATVLITCVCLLGSIIEEFPHRCWLKNRKPSSIQV